MDRPESTQHPPLDGLHVTLNSLDYSPAPEPAPAGRSHLFAYCLTIHNKTQSEVTILARKWVIKHKDGEIDVIEGDKVIGKTPLLSPGSVFTYTSFHLVGGDAQASGAFHGVDAGGMPFSIPIPAFRMTIPEDTACS